MVVCLLAAQVDVWGFFKQGAVGGMDLIEGDRAISETPGALGGGVTRISQKEQVHFITGKKFADSFHRTCIVQHYACVPCFYTPIRQNLCTHSQISHP